MSENDKSSEASVAAVLDGIMIAAPCDMSWENMEGDERVRFCGACKLNVYNTSAMTRREVVELMSRGGRLPCLRIYRRFDGTLITDDCPVGLRKIRDAYRLAARRMAAGWAALVSLVTAVVSGLVPAWGQENSNPNSFVSIAAESAVQIDQKQTQAHREALEYFQKAHAAALAGRPEADKFYQKALSAMSSVRQDPKFVETVYGEYGQYLKKHHQAKRAAAVLAQLSKFKTKCSDDKLKPVLRYKFGPSVMGEPEPHSSRAKYRVFGGVGLRR